MNCEAPHASCTTGTAGALMHIHVHVHVCRMYVCRCRGNSRKKIFKFSTMNIKFDIVGNDNLGARRLRGRASISQKMSENGSLVADRDGARRKKVGSGS